MGRRVDVVLLIGPLGAAKTLLTKGIALGMGISEEVSSPTYTIVSEYGAEKKLYHIDLYRVEGREQTENLGLDDILGSDGVSVVEWGEKLMTDFPSRPIRVHLSVDSPDRRTILVEGLEP